MSLAIKKQDTVLVLTGKEKGKKGRVLAVMPSEQKLIIERINMIKKHMKPSKSHQQGGIIEKEAAVHRCKVMLVCPKCGVPTRIQALMLGDGRKVRSCQKCKEAMDQ